MRAERTRSAYIFPRIFYDNSGYIRGNLEKDLTKIYNLLSVLCDSLWRSRTQLAGFFNLFNRQPTTDNRIKPKSIVEGLRSTDYELKTTYNSLPSEIINSSVRITLLRERIKIVYGVKPNRIPAGNNLKFLIVVN